MHTHFQSAARKRLPAAACCIHASGAQRLLVVARITLLFILCKIVAWCVFKLSLVSPALNTNGVPYTVIILPLHVEFSNNCCCASDGLIPPIWKQPRPPQRCLGAYSASADTNQLLPATQKVDPAEKVKSATTGTLSVARSGLSLSSCLASIRQHECAANYRSGVVACKPGRRRPRRRGVRRSS